ncbi:DUF4145 domain-containing protein, partial [Sphaerimonospora mesophila]|uniref:DUF4145 domain-containing protein n=1 Tax=Sphaerimonospora mesophila TaxID=37483 RepID=UPI00128F52B3
MALVAVGHALEAVGKNKGFTSGTLEKKMERLRDAGIIDNRLFDWATHLRNVRNEGAHDHDFDPDLDEAEDARA